MIRGKRFDASRLLKATRTEQGYLRAPANVTRTGVFTYVNPDGSLRRELRHPEDVFAPESLATLKGIPLTDEHPNVVDPTVMLLDPKNTKRFIAGYTGDDVGQDDEHVTAIVTVTDDGLIRKIELGQAELSCGYLCDKEEVSGTYNGERYDVRQRNIRYNHLSSVPVGRAGSSVRIHLDSADAVQVDPSSKPLEEIMEKIVIDGVTYEVTPQVAQAYHKAERARTDAAQKADADLKAAQAATVAEKARADGAEGQRDNLKGELEKAKTEIKARTDAASSDNVRKAAKELNRIEGVARRVCDKDTVATLDKMDDKAIKIAVIKAESKDAVLDGKSDDYVNARFDAIAEKLGAESANNETKHAGDELAKARADAAAPDSEKARKKMLEREGARWLGEAKKA